VWLLAASASTIRRFIDERMSLARARGTSKQRCKLHRDRPMLAVAGESLELSPDAKVR